MYWLVRKHRPGGEQTGGRRCLFVEYFDVEIYEIIDLFNLDSQQNTCPFQQTMGESLSPAPTQSLRFPLLWAI